MSEEQKIWFVYLGDHHEGPFTIAEVAPMVAARSVTAETLAWKDGMAEWVPLGKIPELASVLSPQGTSSPEPAPAQPAAEALSSEAPAMSLGSALLAANADTSIPTEAKEEISLAQALAASQQQLDEATGPPLDVEKPQLVPKSEAPAEAEPKDPEVTWAVRLGTHVTGLFSMTQIKQMARAGELQDQHMFWHPGWDDFRPLAAFSELLALKAAAEGKEVAPKPLLGESMGSSPRSRLAALPAGFVPEQEDPTDPSLIMPMAAHRHQRTRAFSLPKMKGAVVILGLLVLVGAGAGSAYYFFLSSPLPRSLDVKPEDLREMSAAAKQPVAQGGRLYLAPATGTEDSPADPTNPKYYVATNLAEGALVRLSIKGLPGTLLNATRAEKMTSVNVGKNHLASFDNLKGDNGKPLPMGEYSLTASADGAAPLEKRAFLGGRRSATYESRLKQYKEKLQKDYDDEVSFLRESVRVLKEAQGGLSNHIASYKTDWPKQAKHASVIGAWRSFQISSTMQVLPQLDQKSKDMAAAPGDRYYPNLLKDISQIVGQMQQLVSAHSLRLQGKISGVNLEELEGWIQAGVVSLDSAVSQAVLRSPTEALDSASLSTPSTPTPSASTTPMPVATGPSQPPLPVAPVSPAPPTPPQNP